jgi:putative aminopeptidase FrvX
MELLRILSNTAGVSGFEERVQQIVAAELESACNSPTNTGPGTR